MKGGQDLVGTGLPFKAPLSNILLYNLGVQDSGLPILGLVSPFPKDSYHLIDVKGSRAPSGPASLVKASLTVCRTSWYPSTFSFFLLKSFRAFSCQDSRYSGPPKTSVYNTRRQI